MVYHADDQLPPAENAAARKQMQKHGGTSPLNERPARDNDQAPGLLRLLSLLAGCGLDAGAAPLLHSPGVRTTSTG